MTKRSGSFRLIEAPKPRLKQVQRSRARLRSWPTFHRTTRRTASSRAALLRTSPRLMWAGLFVLKMDLRDFFVTITAPGCGHLPHRRIPRARRPAAGRPVHQHCPARVLERRPRRADPEPLRLTMPLARPAALRAAALAAGCTDFARSGQPRGLSVRCPAGRPCSAAAGAVYTRYADDLVFSGGDDFARSVHRFKTHVAAIAIEEGFAVQHRKTRVMRRGVRQRAAGSRDQSIRSTCRETIMIGSRRSCATVSATDRRSRTA